MNCSLGLAPSLQRPGIPDKIVEKHLNAVHAFPQRLEKIEIHWNALIHNRAVDLDRNINGTPDGHHLQFDDYLPQLLYSAGAAGCAVAYEPNWLSVPFQEDRIQCILEDGRIPVVIFRRYYDEGIAVPDFPRPLLDGVVKVFACALR